jgi:ribosomal protein L37AE/L43A
MGLRCIIGHDYGEPQRTRERDESGDELVVTVREYRECRQCGHQKTISENTEVRTSETSGADGAGGASHPRSEGSGATDDTARPSMERDGSTEPAADAATGSATTAGSSADEEAGDTAAARGASGGADREDVTAAEDDGIILEDDTDDADRERGEWPETDGQDDDRTDRDEVEETTAGTAGTGHGDWPTPDAEDEGYAAEPTSGGPDDSVDFGGGLTPERSKGDAPVHGATTAGGTTAGGESGNVTSGITRADSDPAARQRPPDDDTVLSCPRCDHTAPPRASSLRPGDICPECGEGYLTEREE